VALIDILPRAHNALATARAAEAMRITDAIRDQGVVGVLGEAEVGKTETVRQAIAPLLRPSTLIHLDLDGAASDESAAFLLAKQIARALVGPIDFSLLSAGALLPSRVEAGRIELAELLGADGLEEATRAWPSGTYPLPKALRALATLASRGAVVLWIDHLEAPSLTPRHPLQIDRMLWGVRELSQRAPELRVVLSGREGAGPLALNETAAFHQQGRWLSLDLPLSTSWEATAAELGVPAGVVHQLRDLLDGHPATMLLALIEIADGEGIRHPYEVVRDLASSDAGLTGRTMQHARSLHRLGGQVLTQIALGEKPYAATQRGRATQQEITKVLGRLRLAGLLRHDAEGWSVINPLVAIGIRQQVRSIPAADAAADPDN